MEYAELKYLELLRILPPVCCFFPCHKDQSVFSQSIFGESAQSDSVGDYIQRYSSLWKGYVAVRLRQTILHVYSIEVIHYLILLTFSTKCRCVLIDKIHEYMFGWMGDSWCIKDCKFRAMKFSINREPLESNTAMQSEQCCTNWPVWIR